MPICNLCGEEKARGWEMKYGRHDYFFCTREHLIMALLTLPCFVATSRPPSGKELYEREQALVDAITKNRVAIEYDMSTIKDRQIELINLIVEAMELGRALERDEIADRLRRRAEDLKDEEFEKDNETVG